VSGRPEGQGPVTLFARHVVIPAAIIAMVTAFLFYLLEVRSVFLGGATGFKQVGLCFSAATVLIARYSRVSGSGLDEGPGQGCYTVALAVATLLFMMTRSGAASFAPNLLILAALRVNSVLGVQLFDYIGESSTSATGGAWDQFVDRVQHLVLPTVTLALGSIAGYSRYQRNASRV